jgi:hypothetical protein
MKREMSFIPVEVIKDPPTGLGVWRYRFGPKGFTGKKDVVGITHATSKTCVFVYKNDGILDTGEHLFSSYTTGWGLRYAI